MSSEKVPDPPSLGVLAQGHPNCCLVTVPSLMSLKASWGMYMFVYVCVRARVCVCAGPRQDVLGFKACVHVNSEPRSVKPRWGKAVGLVATSSPGVTAGVGGRGCCQDPSEAGRAEMLA